MYCTSWPHTGIKLWAYGGIYQSSNKLLLFITWKEKKVPFFGEIQCFLFQQTDKTKLYQIYVYTSMCLLNLDSNLHTFKLLFHVFYHWIENPQFFLYEKEKIGPHWNCYIRRYTINLLFYKFIIFLKLYYIQTLFF